MPAHRFFRFLPVLPVLFLLGAVPAFGAMDASILPAPNAAGKWGYVDAATGKTRIAPQFSRAEFFYDGAAIVSREYPEEAYSVKTRDGRAVRRVPERDGIIDMRGKEILPPLYVVKRANTNMGRTWEGRFIPRLFLVEGGEGKSLVLHADKGEIVPAGKHGTIRFTPEGGVFCDGAYYMPDGVKISPPSGCVVAYAEQDTGMYRVREKEDDMGTLEGVIRSDGSLLVPVKYHDIESVPEAGVWLASRVDASVKVKAIAALLTGKDPEIRKDKDILTVDVYDASGTLLRSFRAHEPPGVRGKTYSYTSKGREYRVNAATGESAPEKERPADTAGYRVFTENKLFGIRDASGTVTVRPEYEALSSLGGGLFAGTRRKLSYEDNYGVIDGSGKEILPFAYGGISATSYPTRSTGLLLCHQYKYDNGDVGTAHWLIDRAGRFVTPKDKPYQSGFYFNAAGQADVYCGAGRHGVIDHMGREVLPCVYETVFDELGLNEGKKRNATPEGSSEKAYSPRPQDALYRVERDNLWGLYDGTGRELIPIRYGFLSLDRDDLGPDWAAVEDAKRIHSGLVNFRTGRTIPPEYGSVRAYPGFFLAWGQEEDKDGYSRDVYMLLDGKGREFARYGRAEWFKGAEVLAAREGRSYALLDKNGKPLTPFRYEDVSRAEGSFVWGKTEAGRVLLDGKGKEYRIK